MDVKAGKFEKIIFKRLSRLGRNAMDLLALYEEFEDKYQVELISIDEGIKTTTPTGRLLRNVLSVIAEFERDTICDRMREGKQMKLKNHAIYGGKIAYGYRFDKNKGKIFMVSKEKKIYLKIVDMFLNQNESLNEIAVLLNGMGIKSKKGKNWVSNSLSRMMKNTAYKGFKVINKYKYRMVGSTNKRITIKDGDKSIPVLKPKSEWVTFQFPKFIDERRWNQIQRKIKFNILKARDPKFPHKFFLARLMKCGLCGSRIAITTGYTRKKAPLHYYRCRLTIASPKIRMLYSKERCILSSVRMKCIDDFVWDKVVSLLSFPEKTLLELVKNKKLMDDLFKDRDNKKTELINKEVKIDRYVEQIGDISDKSITALIMKKIHRLSSDVEKLKSNIDIIERQIETIDEVKKEVVKLDFRNNRESLSECLSLLPDIEKKDIVRQIISLEESDCKPIVLSQTISEIKSKNVGSTRCRSKINIKKVARIAVDLCFNLRIDRVVKVIDSLKKNGFIDKEFIMQGIDNMTLKYPIVPIKETFHILKPLKQPHLGHNYIT
jgi:site-specific DNA recombinase